MKCQRTLTSILAHIAIALQQFISALLKVSMDGDFHCALCPFSGNSIAEFSSHVIRFHKNDPGFLVKCSFCSATYQKYDSYRRHLNRKHSVCTESGLSNDDHTENDTSSTEADNDVTFQQEVSCKVAGMILKLKAKHNVSQTVVNTVVENIAELLGAVQQRTMVAVEQLKNNSFCGVDDSAFTELTDTPLFDNLQSQFKQQKYFVDVLGMVEPVKVKLGQSERLTEPRRSQLVSHYGFYIPFLRNLSKLLSCPEVLCEVQQCSESSTEFCYDICDGEFIRSHPLYAGDPNFLKFLLFCDDLELCNPIGSHTKIHKITVWYWLLLNIPPMYRSRLPVIQLLGIAKSAHVKQFGMDKMLADFCDGMTKLASGVALPGLGVKTGALVVVVADTPAANQIGGFKEGVGFASRKCRTCNCSVDEMNAFFRERDFRMRVESEHIERCETLTNLSRAARQYWSREYGINSRSALMDFPHFSITQCLIHDIMHVLFEGICPLVIRHLLRHLVCRQKYFSVDSLNALLHSFSYVSSWRRMKPMAIDRAILTDDCKSLKQDSAQTWCLMMHLPLLIAKFIPATDQKWINFLRLQQIVILSMSHRTSQLTIAQLEHIISVHNFLFQKLYSDVPYIPKLHFLVHLPSQISKFGPSRNMWAMRMEAKNGKFKRKKWNNLKNLPFSLSMFHQQSMCYEQTTGSGEPNPFFLRCPDIVAEGKMVSLGSYQYASVLVEKNCTAFTDPYLMLTLPQMLTIHGITYSRGSVVYYQRPSEYSYPSFASIVDIVVFDNLKFLLLQPLDIKMYDLHRNCYVTESNSTSPILCYGILELWSPWLPIQSVTDVVITEDYIVEEI